MGSALPLGSSPTSSFHSLPEPVLCYKFFHSPQDGREILFFAVRQLL